MFVVWRCLFGVLTLLLLSVASASAAVADWSGDWDSTWRDRTARIKLVQSGDDVTGHYRLKSGQIQAKASERVLRGTWTERGRHGSFVAVMAADGKTFTARFGSGEWLTGIRVEADGQFQGQPVDRSSPAMVAHHFLNIMNAIGPGRMELLSEASLFLDFSGVVPSQVSELDYTQALFNVLDAMTFRIWSLQPAPGATEYTAQLHQAGTDVTFLLDFKRSGEDWFIVPPSFTDLQSSVQRARHERPVLIDDKNAALASPRHTMQTLVRAFDNKSPAVDQALSTLNLSQLSGLAREYEAPRLARYINRSLQRIGVLTWQEIPDDPKAMGAYVHFEHPLGAITLEPVATDEGVVWQFSPETLQNIRAVYAALDNMPPSALKYVQPQVESLYFRTRDAVRGYLPTLVKRAGPMEIWQWLGLGLVLFLAFGIGKLVNMSFYALVIGRFLPSADHTSLTRFFFLWSFRLMVLGVLLRASDHVLAYPDLVQVVIAAISWSCVILSGMMLVLLAIGLIVERMKSAGIAGENHFTLISFIAGIIRIVVIVSAVLLLADVLQVPYQSVLAGLGLGGLAVALAAQSTLQNFISGITLYFDKPIAVGDYCKFGDKTGTIEFIGLRSTRIRTLDRTVLTIPNSEFSNMQIENYAKRDSIFLNSVLKLRYETTPDQLRFVLVELRKLLLGHPKVASDPLRVRFDGFGSHSLDISIFAYVMSSDYTEYVAIREDIYLRVLQLIEASGTKLAVPAVVHYNTRDHMPDKAIGQESEAHVQEWREEGRLPFPDFTWQEKAALRESLDYPPEGSVEYAKVKYN